MLSRVTTEVAERKNGSIRAAVLVDGHEVSHKLFTKGEMARAREWARVEALRQEDEVYANAKG